MFGPVGTESLPSDFTKVEWILSMLTAEPEKALRNAIVWLISKQGESGQWQSEHYGAMKQGAALTSLVIYALSHVPVAIRQQHSENIQQAFSFLQPGIQKRKRVGNPDGSLDNPVYSSAMLLTAVQKLGRDDKALVRELANFLIRSQVNEKRGFDRSDRNHGGWDVLGPDIKPGKTSGPNISVTRFVLEALTPLATVQEKGADEGADAKPDGDAGAATFSLEKEAAAQLTRALADVAVWVETLCGISKDGGLRFSSQPKSALNKARDKDSEPVSYGSATCDGLLSLYFLGKQKSTQFKEAMKWMLARPFAGGVPGFDASKSQQHWQRSLQFYYCQSFGSALKLTDQNSKWTQGQRKALVEFIVGRQSPNGSFVNPSALMREDDPVIATCFAIVALASLIES